jgi:hypothetical protein
MFQSLSEVKLREYVSFLSLLPESWNFGRQENAVLGDFFALEIN